MDNLRTIATVSKPTMPLVLMVLMLLCSGCNPDVELCYGDHPHRAQIVFEISDNQYAKTAPEQLMLFLERSRHHMQINGEWRTEAKTFSPITDLEETYCRDGRLYAPSGEWRLAALSSKYIDLIDRNDINLTLSRMLDEMWIEHKSMSYVDLPTGRFRYWHDRNSYSGYLAALDNTPVLLGDGAFSIDEYASEADVTTVPVKFTPITQEVHVNIPISTDAGIVVDSLTAEMSGICGRIQISTREVNIEKTYKVIFPTEIKAGNPTMACGTFFATGIVSPSSRALITGPGILSVMVFIHYEDNDGLRKTRTLEASVNMFSQISKSPSVLADDNGRVFQAAEELTYNIPVLMHLSRNKVTSIGDAALEQWVDQTQIDVDY